MRCFVQRASAKCLSYLLSCEAFLLATRSQHCISLNNNYPWFRAIQHSTQFWCLLSFVSPLLSQNIFSYWSFFQLCFNTKIFPFFWYQNIFFRSQNISLYQSKTFFDFEPNFNAFHSKNISFPWKITIHLLTSGWHYMSL